MKDEMTKVSKLVVVLVIAGMCLCGSVKAGFVEPVGIIASSQSAGFEAGNLITGDLNGAITSTTDTFETDGFGKKGWESYSVTNPLSTTDVTVVYDFGSAVELKGLVLWNWIRFQAATFNYGTDRSVKDFTVAFSTDGTNYAAATAFEAARATSTTAEVGQVFDFDDVIAQYAKITVLTNHGGVVGDAGFNEYAALNELHFVPEPATLALLGLGCMGIIRRRKA